MYKKSAKYKNVRPESHICNMLCKQASEKEQQPLSPEDMKRLTDLFMLFIEIDRKRQKRIGLMQRLILSLKALVHKVS